jgi:hypothetical protein
MVGEKSSRSGVIRSIRSDQITLTYGFYTSPIPKSAWPDFPSSEIGPRLLASSQAAMEGFPERKSLGGALSSRISNADMIYPNSNPMSLIVHLH